MRKILFILLISILLFSCSKEKTIDKNLESSASISFDDNEIRYYEKIYHKSFGDCNDEKDCAEIKIEYPEIISIGDAFDSVNSFVKNRILNLPFNEDKYKSMDEISDSLFSEYIDVKKEFDDYHTGCI